MTIPPPLSSSRRATQTTVALLVSLVLGATLAIVGNAAQALALGTPATTLSDNSGTAGLVGSSSTNAARVDSNAQASTHQPYSTVPPRPDGRGVPSGGGEVAPVLGVTVVALILGGTLVLLLMTARRTRHLRKGEDGDR